MRWFSGGHYALILRGGVIQKWAPCIKNFNCDDLLLVALEFVWKVVKVGGLFKWSFWPDVRSWKSKCMEVTENITVWIDSNQWFRHVHKDAFRLTLLILNIKSLDANRRIYLKHELSCSRVFCLTRYLFHLLHSI